MTQNQMSTPFKGVIIFYLLSISKCLPLILSISSQILSTSQKLSAKATTTLTT